MGIETLLSELNQSIKNLTAVISAVEAFSNSDIKQNDVKPEMPTPPSFEEKVPEVNVIEELKIPFSNSKELIEYVMGTYKELGAEKGARIQLVLNKLGYQNINDVKPADYLNLFTGIEEIKKI